MLDSVHDIVYQQQHKSLDLNTCLSDGSLQPKQNDLMSQMQ